MQLRKMHLTAAILVILLVASTTIAGPIESRISAWTLTLPQSLEANSSSWCTWTSCSIGPRLYLAPRSDGSFLVGWTDNYDNGHVSTVSKSSISATHNFAGSRVRGLVAHTDGSYAVLLKNGVILSLSKRGDMEQCLAFINQRYVGLANNNTICQRYDLFLNFTKRVRDNTKHIFF